MHFNVRAVLLTGLAFTLFASNGVARSYPQIRGMIENRGQWPVEVLFLKRQPNLDVWVTRSGIVFDQYKNSDGLRNGHVLKLNWVDAQVPVEVHFENVNDRAQTVSFFNGADKNSWATATYMPESVRLKNVYNGIDVVYYIDPNGNLRYDFDVRPGANVKKLGFQIEGDAGVDISPTEVNVRTTLGTIAMGDLYAYVLGRKNLGTPATFVAKTSSIEFSVPLYDGTVPLRVDPVVYGTYLGGADNDVVKVVRISGGAVIVGGTTSSLNFPQTVGKYSKQIAGETDAFIAKFSSDLSTVVAYTFYGGSSRERLADLVVDMDGNICATGETESNNLPTSIGAVGQIYKGQIDAFILKMPPSMDALTISTYLGGNKDDKPTAIAVESGGNIFVAGGTTSNLNFPVTLAHQSTLGGNIDGFLARLSLTGGSFSFCTYYGKSGNESFTALALDAAASPYVTGSTTSSDFETAPTPGRFSSGRVPYDRTYNGGNTDAFLIKFFPDGTLSKRDDGTFSTFFGGNNDEEGRGIFVDATGRPVLVGVTTSTNLPAVGTIGIQPYGKRDIFMAVFTEDGRGLTSCTYFGGSGDDDVFGIEPQASFNSGVMFGTTTSNDFPAFGTGSEGGKVGATDGFLSEINTASNIFTTLINGGGADTTTDVAIDANGDMFFVVAGTSDDLPVSENAWQKTRNGGTDGYVGKFAHGTLQMASPQGGETWCGGATKTISWQVEGMKPTETYLVQLSSNSGTDWETLAPAVIGTNYNWKIPAAIPGGSTYEVRVSTTRGHVVQSETFTITAPPVITQQPTPVAQCAGTSATLSVTATGTGLRYQWRKANVNLLGQTNPTYNIASLSAADAGKYDCVVSGTCTPNATSTAVDVSIAASTAITTQPAGTTVNEGQGFTLTVVATGGGLNYQWKLNGVDVLNATSASYHVASATSAHAGSYICEITGGCGNATSQAAVVVVNTSGVSEDLLSDGSSMKIVGPNPASNEFTISILLPAPAPGMFTLTDQRGVRVWTSESKQYTDGYSTTNISVANLASGVYLVEFRSEERVMRATINVTH